MMGFLYLVFKNRGIMPQQGITLSELMQGASTFIENLKIETVVAEKLKVMVKPEKKYF